MKQVRVYLCSGDQTGWAIDEDRRQTCLALEALVELVDDPRHADVIHSCWWLPLMRVPQQAVSGKPVICHMAGEPARCLSEPDFLPAMRRVTHWIAQSSHSFEQLRDVGANVTRVPYSVDVEAFSRPRDPPSPLVVEARHRLPADSYVIANFHRDTAGAGLNDGKPIPKLVKGPDIFVEILTELKRRGINVVALLAGPRRHWTRSELKARGVPFVFVGRDIERDDYPANIVPQSDVAHLYQLAHLVLSCGRSEGGPRSVLEAAASRVPQIATDTGISRDILSPDCVFGDAVQAVELIIADINEGALKNHIERHYATIQADHTVAANHRRFSRLYRDLSARLDHTVAYAKVPGSKLVAPLGASVGQAARSSVYISRHSSRRVCLWNKFTPPPWGGGNQFMLALKAEAQRQGYHVGINGEGMESGEIYDGHIINSVQFDIASFESLVRPGDARVVHRIDGPIGVLRGTPEGMEQDRRCFDLNATYATSTVIQSWYTMRALGEMGFSPVKPILIHNACDPGIFWAPDDHPTIGERLKVIATCWSPSPGKGAAIYEWMAWNLPEDEFELTFVGNCPLKLPRWRVLPPLASEELATLLRTQDVYVTASRNDPCSNALIEAVSCGLPALYLHSGGHPELTGFGGQGFKRPHEIPNLLRRLRDHHQMYRNLRRPATMSDVAERYLKLACGDGDAVVTTQVAAGAFTP